MGVQSNIFGKPLHETLNGNDNIPVFLQKIIPRIEKFNKMQRLYVSTADPTAVEKIMRNTTAKNYRYLEKKKPPELTTALTKFFEMLPEPLIPQHLVKYYSYIQSEQFRQNMLKQYIEEKVDHVTQQTLNYILVHLINVMKMSEHNGMTLPVVIHIWTPILCRKELYKQSEEKSVYEEFITCLFHLNNVSVNTLDSGINRSMPVLPTSGSKCDLRPDKPSPTKRKNNSRLFSTYDN